VGVLAVTLFGALNLAAAAAGAGGDARSASRPTPASVPVQRQAPVPHGVRPGETLWAIASRLAGPDRDPRPLMDRHAVENGLVGGNLQAGQTILLPAAG